MDLQAALALIAATALLVAIPGPNVALIAANTLAHGLRFGVVTVLGTTVGVALQLAVVVSGLALVLQLAAAALIWLKWLGVTYLLFLGIAALSRGDEDLSAVAASSQRLLPLFWQGLLLATINPKTLLFNAAFLPQFVSGQGGPAGLVVPAVLFVTVIFVGDLAWAALAQSARPLIQNLGRLRHRLTGILLIGSGIGLALARSNR